MFLKLKKCDTVVIRKKTSTDNADWEENDLKAMNITYISNKQLEFISEEQTAHGIMKKLDEMYLKEFTALQIVCRNRVEK